MTGSKRIFNGLFDSFQSTAFFKDALYSFSWIEELSTGINRVTGESTSITNTYSCQGFLVNPSKSERPSSSVFKDIQAGDIAVLVQQNELILAPPLNHAVTFRGETYICKEVVPDVIDVSWKILLRK